MRCANKNLTPFPLSGVKPPKCTEVRVCVCCVCSTLGVVFVVATSFRRLRDFTSFSHYTLECNIIIYAYIPDTGGARWYTCGGKNATVELTCRNTVIKL